MGNNKIGAFQPYKLLAPGQLILDDDAQQFNDEQLRLLAGSISKSGLIEPLTVRPAGAFRIGQVKQYKIVLGRRRYLAALAAGLTEIPCLIRVLSDTDAREIRLINTLYRRELTPVEEAEFIAGLRDVFGMSVQDIAARLTKSEDYVRDRLRLDNLVAEGKKWVNEGVLHLKAAYKIGALPPEEQEGRIRYALRENFGLPGGP